MKFSSFNDLEDLDVVNVEFWSAVNSATREWEDTWAITVIVKLNSTAYRMQ